MAIDLPERPDRSDDAGVVHEQVDRPETVLKLGDRGGKVGCVGNVRGDGGGCPSPGLDEADRAIQLVDGTGDDRDRCTGFRQRLGDDLADPSSAAGHERDRRPQRIAARVGIVRDGAGVGLVVARVAFDGGGR